MTKSKNSPRGKSNSKTECQTPQQIDPKKLLESLAEETNKSIFSDEEIEGLNRTADQGLSRVSYIEIFPLTISHSYSTNQNGIKLLDQVRGYLAYTGPEELEIELANEARARGQILQTIGSPKAKIEVYEASCEIKLSLFVEFIINPIRPLF